MIKYLKIFAFIVIWMGMGTATFVGVSVYNSLSSLKAEYGNVGFMNDLCGYIQANQSWPGPNDSFTSKDLLEIHDFNHDVDIHDASFVEILNAVQTRKKYFTTYPHQRQYLGQLVDVVLEARSKELAATPEN